MKNKIKKYLKEFVLFIVVMTIFANALSLYRSLDLNKEALPAEFNVIKDKPVLVHFWATWCPVCKVEAPNIQTISENFQVITIAVKSSDNDEINKYLKENNLDFEFINDYDGSIAQKFGISVYPTTIIYDKDRNVVFSDVGYTSTWGLWLRMLWAGM
ncbi:MAG: protein disulfide oxidoreductase [Sulfurimonas sp.]|uniref:protein disulfide oxidoreductase n=1 Tax=Sulfurimonas sp. TaxID=2022749 RepID=UPI00262C52EF|nr:protein disulfide oxidoreductase [Sulfurimonas sp.]MCW8895981.1 protein disulfide oxidoreductase [Sulfurimonas sp.]MCW8954413.1 protein disulfide oxidoreductase [Sulfurimonas sp.]MCW9067010.1 protein disulfide oxidoreductase [Sulfurimonas sp.]